MLDHMADKDPPRRRNAGRTRSDLLAAAVDRLAHYGYDRTSVRDVAHDAGVDPALVYRYFGTKDALFEEAVRHRGGIDVRQCDSLDQSVRVILDHLTTASDSTSIDQLTLLLHSASHDEAVRLLRDRLHIDFNDGLAAQLSGTDAELRAELIASLVLGVTLLRGTLHTRAIEAAAPEQLRFYLEKAICSLADEPTDPPH
ncbi:TetR/AcrR family transcriptional regulator [Nocardia sp. 2]|uniref:TetR/AcrR family transcriptional regulator n=1 Tax=Nocardia acididurans TaxID=2802282 RepID=A0ABS1M9C2_9NOCA|nr:TetR/AcrR family transcriptional regulator [Nocardia acididurans]MBL1077238.1 TetR/AcrR family transcriptional regulator [Nocardia acididurans]